MKKYIPDWLLSIYLICLGISILVGVKITPVTFASFVGLTLLFYLIDKGANKFSVFVGFVTMMIVLVMLGKHYSAPFNEVVLGACMSLASYGIFTSVEYFSKFNQYIGSTNIRYIATAMIGSSILLPNSIFSLFIPLVVGIVLNFIRIKFKKVKVKIDAKN